MFSTSYPDAVKYFYNRTIRKLLVSWLVVLIHHMFCLAICPFLYLKQRQDKFRHLWHRTAYCWMTSPQQDASATEHGEQLLNLYLEPKFKFSFYCYKFFEEKFTLIAPVFSRYGQSRAKRLLHFKIAMICNKQWCWILAYFAASAFVVVNWALLPLNLGRGFI